MNMQYHLGTLRAGQTAEIDAITELDGAAKRLADLGFVRGATIEMIRPGSPCIVRVSGTRVGLGSGHQQSIRLVHS